jgi:hypothetical protein
MSSLISTATMQAHKATWWVNTGRRDDAAPCGQERIRKTAALAGFWPGHVATCSCGWDSRTDGQIRARAAGALEDHRFTAQTDAEVIAAGACDTCHAAAGDYCTSPDGTRRDILHASRYENDLA